MYGRATNPERFAPLHDVAAEILNQLELKFDMEMRQGYGVDEELEKRCQLARPTVALEPKDARAAPIVFVFSTFPGLLVRFGKWYTTAFPLCGCDACAETVAGEAARLRSYLDDVIARQSSMTPKTSLKAKGAITTHGAHGPCCGDLVGVPTE